MIPIGGDLEDGLEVVEEPSRTYRLDLGQGRAYGMVDGLDAVKQAVSKILQTDRFQHLIYDADYGSELTGLRGRSSGYVRSEMDRRIREALLQDDRIIGVEDMQIMIAADEATATFTVVSSYGNYTEEVSASV
ncbi:hypothetical protein D3C71_748440 [compost metagenome]